MRVTDSGSTDGTLECLAKTQPGFPVRMRVVSIHPDHFDHGDTRNLLASRSKADLLAFRTQDAIPSEADWLATLAGSLHDPRAGAACYRNVPRDDY